MIAVMGGQWGDEGKGKLVDVLGANFDIIARCAGGSNAGNNFVHTLPVKTFLINYHCWATSTSH